MIRAVLLTIALLASSVPVPQLAGDQLLFEMAGSRNGAMPAFSIAPGKVSETTRRVIFVSPPTYANIVSFISSVGSRTEVADEPYFSVTEFQGSTPRTALFVPDRNVGDAVRRAISAFEAQGQRVPAIATDIAGSLPSRR